MYHPLSLPLLDQSLDLREEVIKEKKIARESLVLLPTQILLFPREVKGVTAVQSKSHP